MLALEELTPARLPYQPLPGVSANRATRSPVTRRPVRAGTPPPDAQATASPDAAANAEVRTLDCERKGHPPPGSGAGPRKHPPSSSHPAASAGAGASIPRGSPARRRPLGRADCGACAEPPRGAGPEPASTVAHEGLRLARCQARFREVRDRVSDPRGFACRKAKPRADRAESRQPATPTAYVVSGPGISISVSLYLARSLALFF